MAEHTTLGIRLRRIESPQNSRVKQLRRAFKDAAPNSDGEVAVEGMHMVEEAIRSGLRISTVYFSESARERAHKLLPQLSLHTETLLLPDVVFENAVPTETPRGIAALVTRKSFTLEKILAADHALLLVLAGLQDPGNLGTIARSAEAFGAQGLLLAEGTVSPWNWKALRASAGSLLRIPLAETELATAIRELKSRKIRILATSSHRGTPLPQVELAGAVALLIGNEGAGLSKTVMAQADEIVAIPQAEHVESLNAAIAASVVLYEAIRQRRLPPGRIASEV